MSNKYLTLAELRKVSEHTEYLEDEFKSIISTKVPVITKLNVLYIKKITDNFMVSIIQENYSSLANKDSWFSKTKEIVDSTTKDIKDMYISHYISNIDKIMSENITSEEIIVEMIGREIETADLNLSLRMR